MVSLDFENPWIFATVTMAAWISVFVIMEVAFFDGTPLRGVILGFAGGLVYAVTRQALRKLLDKEK